MEPKGGSRSTATKAWPRVRSSGSQGVQKPRLHRKPCTSTTPRGAAASAFGSAPSAARAGSQSGMAPRRKGCHQPKMTEAQPASAHQARTIRQNPGRGSGSSRLAQAIATNCSTIMSRVASHASARPASAASGEEDHCQATQAAVSSRELQTIQRCQRAFVMPHALSFRKSPPAAAHRHAGRHRGARGILTHASAALRPAPPARGGASRRRCGATQPAAPQRRDLVTAAARGERLQTDPCPELPGYIGGTCSAARSAQRPAPAVR